jgi:hypothetical protein
VKSDGEREFLTPIARILTDSDLDLDLHLSGPAKVSQARPEERPGGFPVGEGQSDWIAGYAYVGSSFETQVREWIGYGVQNESTMA